MQLATLAATAFLIMSAIWVIRRIDQSTHEDLEAHIQKALTLANRHRTCRCGDPNEAMINHTQTECRPK